jgi:hypothetical protein
MAIIGLAIIDISWVCVGSAADRIADCIASPEERES